MSVQQTTRWEDEFAYDSDAAFFVRENAGLEAGDASTLQSHLARRAFDHLKLDGMLCGHHAPLVYFKRVDRIDNAEIASLHRAFWNHGGAPILAIVAPSDIHVYSGCVRPVAYTAWNKRIPAFVQRIERVSSKLLEFRVSVESGEFFRANAKSFDPAHRVDRDLLESLKDVRERLLKLPAPRIDSDALDALLCRLVFTSYLFDRGVIASSYLQAIGMPEVTHLTDVLGNSHGSEPRVRLYRLFESLGKDFNGDLFSDDLTAEAKLVSEDHLDLLDEFFRGTRAGGQRAFWPYDFSVIPIEAISSIYEHFLKDSKRQGAFYTPRFLVEIVLDLALGRSTTLSKRRFLDPACGSGIFLVGLFNRIADEWRAANPNASNGHKARHLRKLLCKNLYGIDLNPTACRIAAFSLYLAYLDQLSPREIDLLREQGHRLPTLVHHPTEARQSRAEGNIWCCDYFASDGKEMPDVDLIVGNPPWANSAGSDSPAAIWCASRGLGEIPGKQIAAGFAWKAAHEIGAKGRVCLLLPHGILFNRSETALEYRRAFLERYAVETVMNLADYQRFLFERSEHAAIVALYRGEPPRGLDHSIQYLTPKMDWLVSRSDVVMVYPEDRKTLALREFHGSVGEVASAEVWSRTFWGTPRDIRLLDRLSSYPRLAELTGRVGAGRNGMRWTISAGVRPPGESDNLEEAETITLPSPLFIKTRSKAIDLFLTEADCDTLPRAEYLVRKKSNKSTKAFCSPHVLIKEGFSDIAYADFDVSFLMSLRAVSGPPEDRKLLIFLAAYLRSELARFFLFHTSSNWGISRQRVGEDELLRVPFPLPDALPDPDRGWQIIDAVVDIYERAKEQAAERLLERQSIVASATRDLETLVDEYFDVLPLERVLIDDTIGVTIPSTRPTRRRIRVPAIQPSSNRQQQTYVSELVRTLNGWVRSGATTVSGHVIASARLGVGIAVLDRTIGEGPIDVVADDQEVLISLSRLRAVVSDRSGTLEIIRGAKIFDGHRLYVVKPIAARFWTQTAALNDADEIAGAILASGQ